MSTSPLTNSVPAKPAGGGNLLLALIVGGNPQPLKHLGKMHAARSAGGRVAVADGARRSSAFLSASGGRNVRFGCAAF